MKKKSFILNFYSHKKTLRNWLLLSVFKVPLKTLTGK